MGIMVQEIRKGKKQPVAEKAAVEKKAYELYEKRGCGHGHDQEDWFEAERLVGRTASVNSF